MAKDKIAYVCDNCGQESAKWIGKCPSCGQWNTFKEIRISNDTGSQAAKSAAQHVRSALQGGPRPRKLSEIASKGEPRIDMMDGELNRVLGGGLVQHRTVGRRARHRQEHLESSDRAASAPSAYPLRER